MVCGLEWSCKRTFTVCKFPGIKEVYFKGNFVKCYINRQKLHSSETASDLSNGSTDGAVIRTCDRPIKVVFKAFTGSVVQLTEKIVYITAKIERPTAWVTCT